jgi:predicted MFS family arabinose efflux permease
MTGILCISIGSIGCYLSSNFLFLQIFYPFDGIGTIIIGAMAYTLVGEHLDIKRRGKAIGWIIAGSSLSGLFGSIIINRFFGYPLGWKSFMIFYVLPLSLIALTLVFFNVPSKKTQKSFADWQLLKKAYKQIFSRKASIACLVGNLFRYTGAIWQIFAVAFIRTKFNVPTDIAAIIVLAGMIGLVSGMVLGGYAVNKVGRKRLLVASTFSVCFIIIPVVFVPELWMAITLYMLAGIIGGLSFSTNINFTLEQTPKARGTMMSINSSFVYLGSAMGAAIGGTVLALFGYQILAFTLVALDFTAALIFALFSKEPCQQEIK